MLSKGLAIGIIVLFIASAVIPMTFGYNIRNTHNTSVAERYSFDRYLYPEYYNHYNASEIPNHITTNTVEESTYCNYIESVTVGNTLQPSQPLDGPMDSPWPMYCHDIRHTGKSPYSTANNFGYEIWNFMTSGWASSSPAIDSDGIIYIGAYEFYAINHNGTLKWEYDLDGTVESCSPAIDENGIIYVGTAHAGNYLHAIYPNGTLKWKFNEGGSNEILASPTIGNDGVIYYASGGGYPPIGYITALYPNGTLKWRYQTNHVMYSSPAIGLDGTIYCGSHDCNVYALYSNNGTLKWKFITGNWVHGSPTIGDDETVYIGSDDGYLYALYPNNGTMKWQCYIGASYASPALDKDGVLYIGVWEKTFYAIYPNGTIKWSFNPGAKIWGSSAAISDDGTIYFGTCDLENTGGIEIVALHTDGVVKWHKSLDTVFSSPAIGSDGTVYIGSNSEPGKGCLNAFGIGPLEADANGPHYDLINQPVQFTGYATGGYRPYTWLWNFGDDQISGEKNPIHTYINPSNYTVTLTVTDSSGNTSSDTTWAKIKESNTPPNKPSITGTTDGKTGTAYDYTFVATDQDNDEWLNYYIDWGDSSNSGWLGPYVPGEVITVSHTWTEQGTYLIKAKAKDNYDGESDWGTLSVTMPLDLQISQSNNLQISQHSSNQLILKMLQRLLLNMR